jgi:hypothetical protein
VMGMGSAQELRKDAVIRMFKIGIIVQLISPGSWTFFYDHLFAAFVDGVMEVASLLMSPFSDYDPHAPWYSMDRLLSKFFSGETSAKIFSTLFSNIWGIIIIPLLYLAIIVFVIALFKAVMIWIVGFIAIAILIVLTPIFIMFILFAHTKEIFEEWWKQMMAFAVQEVILMASLGMLAAIIVSFMERTIGYTVCWSVWADFDFLGINTTGPGWANVHMFSLRFWMPDIGKDMTNIWMDANGDGVRGIQEFAYRYVDLPYFDPVYDKALIAKYMEGRDFLEIGQIMIFLAAVILMHVLMGFIPKMSTALQGGVGAQDSASMFGGDQNGKTGGRKLVGAAFGAGRQILVGNEGSKGGGLWGAAKGTFAAGKFVYDVNERSKAHDKAKRDIITSSLGGGRLGGGAAQVGGAAANTALAGGNGVAAGGRTTTLFGGSKADGKAGGNSGQSGDGNQTTVDGHKGEARNLQSNMEGGAYRPHTAGGADFANKNMKDGIVKGVGLAKDIKDITGGGVNSGLANSSSVGKRPELKGPKVDLDLDKDKKDYADKKAKRDGADDTPESAKLGRGQDAKDAAARDALANVASEPVKDSTIESSSQNQNNQVASPQSETDAVNRQQVEQDALAKAQLDDANKKKAEQDALALQRQQKAASIRGDMKSTENEIKALGASPELAEKNRVRIIELKNKLETLAGNLKSTESDS